MDLPILSRGDGSSGAELLLQLRLSLASLYSIFFVEMLPPTPNFVHIIAFQFWWLRAKLRVGIVNFMFHGVYVIATLRGVRHLIS